MLLLLSEKVCYGLMPSISDKALGKTIYGYDMTLPGMLHAKVLRSKVPHAEIVSINTKKAEKLEGVEAIITAQDIPEVMMGLITQDYHIFAKGLDDLRWMGIYWLADLYDFTGKSHSRGWKTFRGNASRQIYFPYPEALN